MRIRGEYELEDMKKGGQQIIITSVPYTVNKSNLVAKIGDLVRERKLPLLLDVRDESTKEVRVVLEIKKDASPELVSQINELVAKSAGASLVRTGKPRTTLERLFLRETVNREEDS